MCIQKLFILIKMMYSGIKVMVFCIAYHLRMRVDALRGRSLRNPTSHAAVRADQVHTLAVSVLQAQVWLLGLVVSLQTFDHIVWVFRILPSALYIMIHQL